MFAFAVQVTPADSGACWSSSRGPSWSSTAYSLRPASAAPQQQHHHHRRGVDVATHVLANDLREARLAMPEVAPSASQRRQQASRGSSNSSSILQQQSLDGLWSATKLLHSRLVQAVRQGVVQMHANWATQVSRTLERARALSTITASGIAISGSSTSERSIHGHLSSFLAAADGVEVSYASLLSDLSNSAYAADQVSADHLAGLGLTLVASSHAACQLPAGGRATMPSSVLIPDDGHTVEEIVSSSRSGSRRASLDGSSFSAAGSQLSSSSNSSMTTSSTTASSTSATDRHPSAAGGDHMAFVELSSPEAVTAALASAGNPFERPLLVSDVFHTGTMMSDTEDEFPGSVDGHGGVRSSDPPLVQAVQHLASSPDVDLGRHAGGDSIPAPPVIVTCDSAPPSAWFACDDAVTKTRYFAIQGSTNFDHWQINLQFEPEVFEDPSLGVRIHRGVYEAAQKLYDDILPHVKQHLATSPFATIALTGHSLGGSLATVLMLLLVVRGVLTPATASPVYTFGAPAVFCQGAVPSPRDAAERCGPCALNCEEKQHLHVQQQQAGGSTGPLASGAVGAASGATSAGGGGSARSSLDGGCGSGSHRHSGSGLGRLGSRCASLCSFASLNSLFFPGLGGQQHGHGTTAGLLRTLGLSDDHVVNVIMHKDIVPRAFVCDYTSVADILKRWWPSFKDHSSLQPHAKHKSLYSFLGRVAIMRPDDGEDFVRGDALHPMLPDHAGLYRLVDPPSLFPHHFLTSLGSIDEYHSTSSSSAGGLGGGLRGGMSSMNDVLYAFMNNPHPLSTLSDYNSYGPSGSISRYHNPDNYTKGLRGISRCQQQQGRGAL